MQFISKLIKKSSLIFKSAIKYAGVCGVFVKKAFACFFHSVVCPLMLLLKLFVKKAPRVFAAVVAIIMLVTGTVTVAVATGATTAYNVLAGGKIIGSVSNAQVLAEAEILAAQILDNSECNKYLVNTSICHTIVAEETLLDAKELAERIISGSSEITTASVLFLDDVQVAAESDETRLTSVLNKYLSAYKEKNNISAVKLCSNVIVKNIYTSKNALSNLPTAEEYITGGAELPVQTVTIVTEMRTVAYDTKRTNSSNYTVGTEIVQKKGVNGEEEVTYEVCTVDGEIVSKKEISSKTVVEPQTKEVLVGTKHIVSGDKNGGATMLWPLKRVSGSYVSSYVGDGRNHHGMDIVAKKGTPIYAAESGTVTVSGKSSSGYGNYIVIKHSNGLETLYAHCSALYVKMGDYVAAGESIAAVGSTGRSTGNHLHFEVHKNGVFVNPANYIGSK